MLNQTSQILMFCYKCIAMYICVFLCSVSIRVISAYPVSSRSIEKLSDTFVHILMCVTTPKEKTQSLGSRRLFLKYSPMMLVLSLFLLLCVNFTKQREIYLQFDIKQNHCRNNISVLLSHIRDLHSCLYEMLFSQI